MKKSISTEEQDELSRLQEEILIFEKENEIRSRESKEKMAALENQGALLKDKFKCVDDIFQKLSEAFDNRDHVLSNMHAEYAPSIGSARRALAQKIGFFNHKSNTPASGADYHLIIQTANALDTALLNVIGDKFSPDSREKLKQAAQTCEDAIASTINDKKNHHSDRWFSTTGKSLRVLRELDHIVKDIKKFNFLATPTSDVPDAGNALKS